MAEKPPRPARGRKAATAGNGSGRNGSATKGSARKGSTSTPNAASAWVPVIGIGASAGGLEALVELLDHLPINTGMAYVIVTHQHAGHASLLPELLGKSTVMPVVEATDGMILAADGIYLSLPGHDLALHGARLHVMEAPDSHKLRMPINYFFRSLAAERRDRAVGIVLSGTGTDGTLGVKEIKATGGMVIAQEPQTAKYGGMPASAVASGAVDYVLSIPAIPRQLQAHVASGGVGPGGDFADVPPGALAEPLSRIFLLLRAQTGHDFSAYKLNTVRRRVERQMHQHQLQTPAEYLRYLQDTPAEIDTLFRELLINVTRFFRDPEAFDALLAQWLPEYLAGLEDNSMLRIWVPGCSSGEEVYSLAIVLREHMEQSERRFGVQIFGTDLDTEAIETARRGQYPDGIAADVSKTRLERYFVREEGRYQVSKEIRRMAIFAPQSLIRDPPFTRLDLVSCRNVLIYMNVELQQKLLATFAYSLRPGALLLLGTSETLGQSDNAFEPVDKKWKLFRRKAGPSAALPVLGNTAQVRAAGGPFLPGASREVRVLNLIERHLLTRYCPTSIVINERGDIIHVQGRTGTLLEPSEGRPRMNVLEMARDGLRRPLAHAMRQVAADGKELLTENILVKSQGIVTRMDLSVSRIDDPEPIRGLLIASFRESTAAIVDSGRRRSGRSKAPPDYVDTLERELQRATESLQSTVEELETANEELISANEEAQSTNEEMQSSNEELETSQEELQSLNEELHAVNAELRLKIEQLSQASDDMQNLLDSTDIATVFLDRQLRIKRYTETARGLISLIPGDIGRSISDLTTRLRYPRLADDCRSVLEVLTGKVTEIETTDGAAYLVRVLPYRTKDRAVDGLVLTFDNIEELKTAQRAAATLSAYFESVVNSVRELLLVMDQDLRVVRANDRFYRMFALEPAQVEGRLLYQLADDAWDIPQLRALLDDILPDKAGFDDYALDHVFPRLGPKRFLLNGRRLLRDHGLPPMILLSMDDITHRAGADQPAAAPPP